MLNMIDNARSLRRSCPGVQPEATESPADATAWHLLDFNMCFVSPLQELLTFNATRAPQSRQLVRIAGRDPPFRRESPAQVYRYRAH